jgi:hypothetical protein
MAIADCQSQPESEYTGLVLHLPKIDPYHWLKEREKSMGSEERLGYQAVLSESLGDILLVLGPLDRELEVKHRTISLGCNMRLIGLRVPIQHLEHT